MLSSGWRWDDSWNDIKNSHLYSSIHIALLLSVGSVG